MLLPRPLYRTLHDWLTTLASAVATAPGAHTTAPRAAPDDAPPPAPAHARPAAAGSPPPITLAIVHGAASSLSAGSSSVERAGAQVDGLRPLPFPLPADPPAPEPEPDALVFEENGLRIPLLKPGTWWFPVLRAADGRPFILNVTHESKLHSHRALLPGEDWHEVEATMRARLAEDEGPQTHLPPLLRVERGD